MKSIVGSATNKEEKDIEYIVTNFTTNNTSATTTTTLQPTLQVTTALLLLS